MRGRKPKPNEVKILAGNPGKRKLNPGPQLARALPRCPGHLVGEARKEWHRVVRELHEAGLLTRVDRGALAAYCSAWSRWVMAETKLAELVSKGDPADWVTKTASGYEQQTPWLTISNSAQDLMRKFMVEFGMTPSSRSRVTAGEKPAEKSLADILFSDVEVTDDK